jgi:cyclopropane-fatty-acyl-phospholipid synthase
MSTHVKLLYINYNKGIFGMHSAIADRLFFQLDKLEAGVLTLVTPDGQTRTFHGKKNGEKAKLELKDWRVVANLIRKGDIGLAEDYSKGNWDTDNLAGLISLGLANRNTFHNYLIGSKVKRFMIALGYLLNSNTLKGSKRNIHAHYDLGNDFYKLWLDETMTYSSGIYKSENDTLKQAQQNKYQRIIDQLNSDSGRLLEIGCGWGGFAAQALSQGDYDIKGITLSEEQHAYANERLNGAAEIVLEDYRHQETKYDHIVSIEMFEAVGERYWKTYFQKIKQLLNGNGRAVIQTITMNEGDFPRYRKSADFIRSFIFPGGMLPSPTRFQFEAEKQGLRVENSFFFGQDYARTLEEWLNIFDAQKENVQALGFDERFIRLWRFYLAGCIGGFKTERTNVMQVELVHA